MSSFNLGAALADYRENSEITVLDAGEYRLEVTSAASKTSKNGNPTIIPTYKVVGGPYNGKRVLAGGITYTENAAPFFFRTLKGFGITDQFLETANSTPDPIKTIADSLVGRVVDATLAIDNWQGEDRNKLGSVKIADGAGAPAAPPAVAQAAAPAVSATAGPSVPTPAF